jgi:hypothetical protein
VGLIRCGWPSSRFIGGPVIKGLIEAYQAHLTATTTDKQTAADLAGKEIAAQVSESNAIMAYRTAEIGHWYEPDKLMGYFVALYFGKLWSGTRFSGSAPPIRWPDLRL